VIPPIGASALGGNAVDVEARLQETLRLYMYLAVGAFVAGFVATYCWKLTGERQAAQYRQHFLKAILRQDVAWHDARATAGLAAMFAESTQLVEEGLGVRLAEGLRFLGTGIAGVAVALSFQWNVALVLLALSPLAIAAASTLNRVNALTAKRTQAAFAIAGAAAAERIE
ncbi:ABC transporter type 1, transmembrane domain-containing protein, partial [Pavlovales sp. CCMP2436]